MDRKIKPPPTLQEREAEFTTHVRVYRALGVNVSRCFLEVQDKVILAWVRCFGLLASILFVLLAPIVIMAYKVICFKIGMPYDIPDWVWLWQCGVGVTSMLGFGFNLINPNTLNRLTGKPTALEPGEHKITLSGHYIAYGQEDEGKELPFEGEA